MTKRTSCFVNDWYYEQFLVMYKSYLYYGNSNKFRVYNWDNLNSRKVKYLESIGVEVVEVDKGNWSEELYRNNYCFKWKGLMESEIDFELLVDADTLFLDNLDDLLNDFGENDLVVVPEYYGEFRGSNLFNIGLMGYRKESKHLLEESVRNCEAKGDSTEMFELCNLVESKKVKVRELPYMEYMPLWENHNLKKTVSVKDGKFVVSNYDGRRVRFYHFTTHIDPFKNSEVLRFGRDHNTTARMWVKRFNNPVGLIYTHLNFAEDFETVKETTEEWKLKK